MTLELRDILASKQAFRSRLASLPIVEKLELLDQLRERTLDIAASRAQRMSDIREDGRKTADAAP